MNTILLISLVTLFTPLAFGQESNQDKPLKGLKVAILVDNGFEQVEMTEPRKALEKAGAKTTLISPEKPDVTAWKSNKWGDKFPVDVPLEQAHARRLSSFTSTRRSYES